LEISDHVCFDASANLFRINSVDHDDGGDLQNHTDEDETGISFDHTWIFVASTEASEERDEYDDDGNDQGEVDWRFESRIKIENIFAQLFPSINQQVNAQTKEDQIDQKDGVFEGVHKECHFDRYPKLVNPNKKSKYIRLIVV